MHWLWVVVMTLAGLFDRVSDCFRIAAGLRPVDCPGVLVAVADC